MEDFYYAGGLRGMLPRLTDLLAGNAFKDCVIVLQGAGPQRAPGMPEWGQLPIPI